MADTERALVEAILRAVRRLVDSSPEARDVARTVGAWLTSLTSESTETGTPQPVPMDDGSALDSEGGAAGSDEVDSGPPADAVGAAQPQVLNERRLEGSAYGSEAPSSHSDALRMRLGDAEVTIPVFGTEAEIDAARRSAASATPIPPRAPHRSGWQERDVPDLQLIGRRCRIKAEACRAIFGVREGRPGAEQELGRCRQQAISTPECDLWMDDADLRLAPEGIEHLAACFDNTAAIAEGLGVAIKKDADQPRIEELMHLFAEAQSALRLGVERAGVLTSDDPDQDLAFRWLRVVTERDQVYIPRYMRQSDRAEPASHGDLARRIQDATSPFTRVVEREREADKLRKKIEYHAKRIRKAGDLGGVEPDWQTISATVERLAAIEPPTSVPLREILLPIMDLLPEDLEITQSLEIALDSAEKYRTRERGPAPQTAREHSPDTLRVREALRGKRIVIVGGEERTYSRTRIEAAFELGECEWATTSEHGPSQPLVNAVERPGTALVLILIRLAGHQHVDDVTAACRERGVPHVRVPAGYGVQQIVQQIIQQQSEALAIQ